MITSIATCWQIILSNGIIKYYTDHDVDICIGDKLYMANCSFSPSALSAQNNFAADNFELQGIISPQSFTEAQLLQGILDDAKIVFFKVNYNAPYTQYFLRCGVFGEIRIVKNTFIAEVRSQSQLLENKIGQVYSPFCRANFCDAQCTLNAQNYSHHATIEAVLEHNIITYSACSDIALNPYSLEHGHVIFPKYSKHRYNIKTHEDNKLILYDAPCYNIKVGDAIMLFEGCDKHNNTCAQRFKNIINFRGEPFIKDAQRFVG